MLDNLTQEQYDNREAFARFGITLYHAQCLEKTVAMLISFSGLGDRSITSLQIDYEMEENFQKTFGVLINELQSVNSTLPNGVIDNLQKALRIRNMLAHDYWWENSISMLRHDGLLKIIDQMNEYTAMFKKLDDYFMNFVIENRKSAGIDNELIIKTQKEYLSSSEIFYNIKARLLKKNEKIIRIYKFFPYKNSKLYMPIFILEDNSKWTVGDSGLTPAHEDLDILKCKENPSWQSFYPCIINTKATKTRNWEYFLKLDNGHRVKVKPNASGSSYIFMIE